MKRIVLLMLPILAIANLNGKKVENSNTQTERDVKTLVKNAATYFIKNGPERTFNAINSNNQKVSKGDLYTFAYDYFGNCVAIGQFQERIGKICINDRDERGTYYIKEMLKASKLKPSWVEYVWQGKIKRSYVQKVTDYKTNKRYLIGAGYYPNSENQNQ